MFLRTLNIIKFIADFGYVIGDRAPYMVATAFQEAEKHGKGNVLPVEALNTIFDGNSNFADGFQFAFNASRRHKKLGLNQVHLEVTTVILALLGNVPDELDVFFQGEVGDRFDSAGMLTNLLRLVKEDGLPWEDRWITVEEIHASTTEV